MLWKNPVCPYLPEIQGIQNFMLTRRHGEMKGRSFYRDALSYSQSQWMMGKPAQAILQLNKAWMANLSKDDSVFEDFQPPYLALQWMLEMAATGKCAGFIGNPVRHFQHLASRVSGPRAEIRSWRAWLCFHLAEKSLNPAVHPRDRVQIAREGLWIPRVSRTIQEISVKGWRCECRLAALAYKAPNRR